MLNFSQKIVAWQQLHGRHDLPWQNTIDPYAIWVSEIMLQQTQVSAVIGYYQRFMVRFPNVSSLALASQDEVLQHWSGLGYYSRARNLHRAAQKIEADFNGVFPRDFEAIKSLSGIGRSTAAAISSFAFGVAQPILDGNVKRVFARHFLVDGWPGLKKIESQLWLLAEQHMPSIEMVAYTQGLMDLGATICTRSKPKCLNCPVQSTCGAYLQHRTAVLPTPKPKKTIPQKECVMLVLQYGRQIMLEKRPNKGIWGGLWSLPEVEMSSIATEVAKEKFNLITEPQEPLGVINHVFTHFKLAITPQPLEVLEKPSGSLNAAIWLDIDDALGAAIPTPVRTILTRINSRR